jgi:hypothetical protein
MGFRRFNLFLMSAHVASWSAANLVWLTLSSTVWCTRTGDTLHTSILIYELNNPRIYAPGVSLSQRLFWWDWVQKMYIQRSIITWQCGTLREQVTLPCLCWGFEMILI